MSRELKCEHGFPLYPLCDKCEIESLRNLCKGYPIEKVPNVLISLAAKLCTERGVFWEMFIDELPERVDHLKQRIEELESVIRSHGIMVKTYAGGEPHFCWGDEQEKKPCQNV